MTPPLDSVSARLFPSLARYARKQRRLGLLAAAVMIFTSGLACGLLIGSYRGQVADESYNQTVREFGQFKIDYLEHHAKKLTTTKAQAQVIAQRNEDVRGEREP